MRIFYSFKILLLIASLMSATIAKGQSDTALNTPRIQNGVAKLAGKVIVNNQIQPKTLSLSVGNPITSERTDYEISIKEDGRFSQSVPISSITIGNIRSDIYNGGIPLIPGEETILNFTFDDNGDKQVNLISSFNVTADDMMTITDVMMEVLMQPIRPEKYDMLPEDFAEYSISRMEEILQTLGTSIKLSNAAKQLVEINAKLFYLNNILLDYTGVMNAVYMEQYKVDSVPSDLYLGKLNKSYYTFLKHFDINNPLYLYADYYPIVLQSLLKNETLNLLIIGDTPITDWLLDSKTKLRDYIDSDSELFYDLLVANAFSLQLIDMNPLTETQKENIKVYYKNKSFTNTLFDENNKVIQLRANNNVSMMTEETTDVIDNIITKYTGKVIFVDFWATWCGPCLAAIKESKHIKEELEKKGVVFVYITNTTSPRKT